MRCGLRVLGLSAALVAAPLIGAVTPHAGAAASGPSYAFTDLGPNTIACGVNDSDYVTLRGNQATAGDAYVWHGGSTQQLLPFPGGSTANACDINDANQIVGGAGTPSGSGSTGAAALWNAASAGAPQDISHGVAYNAIAINGAGDVVMEGEDSDAFTVGYELASGGGSPAEIGTAYGSFPGSNDNNSSMPWGIADDGSIVAGLDMIDDAQQNAVNGIYLLPSPGAKGTQLPFAPVHTAGAVSGSGYLVGSALRSPGGTVITLPQGFQARAVNNSGTVAGIDAADNVALYENGSVTDLGADLPAGYTGPSVSDINNDGDIVGSVTEGGQPHGFLLRAAGGLTISSLTFAPQHPTVADGSFTATLTLRNDSSGTLSDVTPTLTSSDPTVLSIDSGPQPASADSLAPGDSVSFTYQLTPLKPQTVSVQPAATATDSNGNPVTATPVPPRVVDLSAGDVSVSLSAKPSPGTTNTPTTVTATITNKTTSTLSSLTPSLTSTPATNMTLGNPSPATVGSLAPHASTTVTWAATATKGGTYQLQAAVDLTDPTTGNQETDIGSVQLPVTDTTIVVNLDGDEPDPPASLVNGVCDVDPTTTGEQCTLRAAIQLADSFTDPQVITFDISGAGVPDIEPTSALPAITNSLTIDGTTQPGGWVQLSGALNADNTVDGALTVKGGVATVRGLVIDGWTDAAGITVEGGAGTTIAGDRIGTDPTGTSADPNHYGVISGLTDNVMIGGTSGTSVGSCTGDCDLISGNRAVNVYLPEGADDTVTIEGDYIGTDVTGESALGGATGISASSATAPFHRLGFVVVGGATNAPGVAPGNVIAGNSLEQISNFESKSMTISGNLIGLDAAGRKSLEPATAEDDVDAGGPTLVGGDSASDRNVIGGGTTGVSDASPTDPLMVENDWIGTDAAGTAAVPNGIGVKGGMLDGSLNPSEFVSDSVISGNIQAGVEDVEAVTGSIIGLNADGTAALPNGEGVDNAMNVGGARASGSTSCTGPCNVISGNTGAAINQAVTVTGNFIGTNAAGSAAFPNATGSTGGAGTAVVEQAVTVGGASDAAPQGTCDLACNLIAGNQGSAIESNGTVQGNQIGLSTTGDAMPNTGTGVLTEPPPTNNTLTIGGDGNLGNRIANSTGPAIEATNLGGESSTGSSDPLIAGNAMVDNAGGIQFDSLPGRITQVPFDVTAIRANGNLTITGDLRDLTSAGSNTARVDIYAATSCSGPAQSYLPVGTAQADLLSGSGFSFTAPASLSDYQGDFVATATETPPGGSAATATSTFSACAPVTGATTTTPAPGQTMTVTGPGFTPGEQVSVTLHSIPILLTTVTADESGVANAQITIPASTPLGSHELVLTGLTSGQQVSIPILVTQTQTQTASAGKAATVTTVTVHPHSINAVVAPAGSAAGKPGGDVTFFVDGVTVGGAVLSDGTASLPDTVPAGEAHQVAAAYGGDSDFTGSSGSTARDDPTISASVASAHPKSGAGWYRTPVTVSFHCAPASAPLTGSCPAAVTIRRNGAGQSVTRMITAQDGGIATAVVSTLNVDRTPPVVHAGGAKSGRTYQHRRHLVCRAQDRLSGVAACHVTTHRHVRHGVTTIRYRLVATDNAGNTSRLTGHYRIR